MMKRTVAAFVAIALSGIAIAAASAECRSDADCLSGAACVNGACTSTAVSAQAETEADEVAAGEAQVPATSDEVASERAADAGAADQAPSPESAADDATAPSTPPVTGAAPPPSVRLAVPPPAAAPPSRGPSRATALALAAGLGGLAMAGGMIGVHTALALSLDKGDTTRYALWGTALGAMAITAPLVYAGGAAVRRQYPGVEGISYLRVMGWISYILYLELTVVSLGIVESGVFEKESQSAVFVGTMSGLAVLSLVSFAAEALVVRRQAESAASRAARNTGPVVVPTLSPLTADGRTTGATLGVGGIF